MQTNVLRRWCRPRVILVISTLTDSPAHTLRVVSGLKTAAARVLLVQLPASPYTIWAQDRNLPFLVPPSEPTNSERQRAEEAGQAFLWAEILSEVTVIRNTPVDRIPGLVSSLGADMVVFTRPEIGRIPFRGSPSPALDLFGSLDVPILVCGTQMNMSAWNRRELRNILVPVSFGPDLDLQMRFACRFARRHHGRLTILHVFESSSFNTHPWERTPLAVESRLPIPNLKGEGIMCPMEITVSEGYPERKILSYNQQRPHQLIVMGGPHSRNVLHRFGHSVSEIVMTEARCPVLILGTALVSDSPRVDKTHTELNLA